MQISQRKLIAIFIELILFLAVFNDIIRVPNTVISGYRLLLPIILCMTLSNIQFTWKYFWLGSGMIFLLFIQNIVFCQVFQYEDTIDFAWQLRYLFYYFGIIAIFILMHLLRKKDQVIFKKFFYKGIPIFGILCLISYVGAITPFLEKINFTNWNDYGACLAAVFPWFFMECFFGKKRNVAFCMAVIVALWKGDSKVALCGILIQIGIISSIALIKKVRQGSKLFLFLLPAIIIICFVIILSPIKVNGYSIRIMFTGMASHIIKGEVYKDSSTSLHFRTDAIIYMLRIIKSSHFMGVGIGNTGKLLRQLMPDVVSGQKLGSIALSPHHALLEFFCDCGIWAIILCVYIYGVTIKKMFHAKRLDKMEIFFVTFTLSFPVWIMSSSGIYTIYFIFIIIAWLCEWSKMKGQNMNN